MKSSSFHANTRAWTLDLPYLSTLLIDATDKHGSAPTYAEFNKIHAGVDTARFVVDPRKPQLYELCAPNRRTPTSVGWVHAVIQLVDAYVNKLNDGVGGFQNVG